MATCNGRIDVGRYAIEIKFVHIDRLADAIINQTLYCLSWYNNRLSTAVYNFMQTQKERKPCKIKASAANKRSARRRTRSGGPRTARTGAERRHRTFEPWQGSKKRTIPIWYRSFFHESARRRTRSGGPRPARTGAERRHRTFEPWQGSKIKERYHSVSFFYS